MSSADQADARRGYGGAVAGGVLGALALGAVLSGPSYGYGYGNSYGYGYGNRAYYGAGYYPYRSYGYYQPQRPYRSYYYSRPRYYYNGSTAGNRSRGLRKRVAA